MSCDPFEILIMKHMDGDINEVEHKQLKKHIDQCEKCKNEFKSFEKICFALKEEPIIDPPLTFESDIMKKVEKVNLYKRKLKEKRILAAYFLSSMLFSIVALFTCVIFREYAYNVMIYLNIPIAVVNVIYAFLDKIGVMFEIISTFIYYLNNIIIDMFYLLIGLVSVLFMSKIYESAEKVKIKNKRRTV